MDQSRKATTKQILNEGHDQKRQTFANCHNGRTQSNESNFLHHRGLQPLNDNSTPQHSMVQTDRVPDTSKDGNRYTEPTPIERWQMEGFGQSPWDNISAVKVGEEAMQAIEKQEGQKADVWSTVAVDGGEGDNEEY